MPEFTEKCLIDLIHSESHYEVWIVKVPDMDVETYGVVNKQTRLIESLQPNIFNAKAIAKKFSEWLNEDELGTGVADVLRQVTDSTIN